MAWDLPSADVLRIVSLTAEMGYPINAADGAGKPVNAGQWANGMFDPTAPLTVDWLMVWRNSDGSPIVGNDGKPIHDDVQGYFSSELLNYFYRNAACIDPTKIPEYKVRYPGSTFFNQPPETVELGCSASLKIHADIQAKKPTNNRTKYMMN
jgi:hypothetical protein